MILRVLAEAEAEIEAARQYLNARVLDLGARFLADLTDTLAAVEARPGGFPKLETLPDDEPYRRALLGTFRYAVIFEIVAGEVIVVAVAHTSRAPNYWLGRHS